MKNEAAARQLVTLALLLVASLALPTVSQALPKACFANRLPYFAMLGQTNMSGDDAIDALSSSCNEIGRDEMMEAKSRAASFIDSGANSFGLAISGGIATRYSRMNSTPLQRKYMKEIEKIRKVENPIERARLAYLLASRHSGVYDEEGLGLETYKSGTIVFAETPENLLNNFEKNGSIGVCREFAALLNWTLGRVTRSPKTGKVEFETQVIGGSLPAGRHVWVRARFAKFGRTAIDFDSTYHEGKFVPLAPRRSGLSESRRQRAYKECNEIIDCIQKEIP
jgi:hypothetical protein